MTNEKAVADRLIQTEAVQLNLKQPFTWASGWKSPIYCDNRKILSFPYVRDFIKSELCNVVFERFPDAQLIAAVATAGIAWGAMVADQLKLPFVYVRPKPKEHGLGNQIEGFYTPGQRSVLIEDLISTGKSSLQSVQVLRAGGLKVDGLVSIFSYDFDLARQNFEKENVSFYSLTTYPVLIRLAKEKNAIAAADEAVLLKWRAAPMNWTGFE